ncbi:MAG: crossover junction endodeoxyribonuclease RuvC [Nevskiaceae bacterium]|nr:MAG: crossover junction endodeoxyribonuclease RuvC [Nevskiaceae bacterium]TBR74184.1 MAG: crossover junction endodeoxyribonuclease RuvC [Nevskiaceae bacterium]
MRILGVDPGSRITGYGVIEVSGPRVVHVASGAIRCRPAAALAERLKVIYAALADVLAAQHPDEVAVESVFVRRNVNSALVLGHARGVALLALAQAGLEVHEYAPAQIKSTIVGNGRAEKRQVQYLVRALLALHEPLQPDAADALAIALCHSRMRDVEAPVKATRRPVRGEGYRSYVA